MIKKLILSFSFFTAFNSYAQVLSAPTTEGIYGGTVKDIATWSFHADSVYVVVSTESPNSIFYAKAYRGAKHKNFDWKVLPSAGSDDNYGDKVNQIEVHSKSNSIFFLHEGNLYKTNVLASAATKVDSLVKNFIIKGNTMILLKNNVKPSGNDTLVFGTLNLTTGTFLAVGGKNLMKRYKDIPQLEINQSNNQLYILDKGTAPHIYTLTDPFNALTSSSPLTSVVNPSPTIAGIEWRTIGYGPDGTWYIAGQPELNNPTSQDRKIAWSTNNGFSWQYKDMDVPGPQGGVVGSNMVIQDVSGFRSIMVGNAANKDTSKMDIWNNVGSKYVSNLNRANDGTTVSDLIMAGMNYHTTNIGFGYSTNYGDSIFGWNKGLEAVQVNDIEMTDDYKTGWIASKSGIRKVENYNTSSEIWANPYYPNLDGAPYEAVAIDKNNADTIFVGNQRIYRSINGGVSSGSSDGWSRVFTPEIAPYNFNSINYVCSSIDISRKNSKIVAASYVGKFGQKGGVFYSMDGGNTWTQMKILTSSVGQDVNVLDVQFTYENNKIVLYMAIESNPMVLGAFGVYRSEYDGTSWSTPIQNGAFGATDSVVELELSKSQDSLLVLNVDPGVLPINNVLIKNLTTGSWNNTKGPMGVGGKASAITLGAGVIFMAINQDIYAISSDFSSGWSLAYSYPVGTAINVLFYDDLLVGTGTGLYAHALDKSSLSLTSLDFNKSSLFAYPNPVEDILRLSSKLAFKIIDINGLVVFDSYSKEMDQVNVSKLEQGMYFIQTSEGNSIKFTKL